MEDHAISPYAYIAHIKASPSNAAMWWYFRMWSHFLSFGLGVQKWFIPSAWKCICAL